MRRRVLIALTAGGLLLAAVVVATRAGDENEARMVTVPHVSGTSIRRAYELARAAGFQVEVSNEFSMSALCEPIAERQVPRGGALEREGGVIKIDPGMCPIASPGVRRPMPTATVPDFAGRPASDVVGWAERRGMFWAIRGGSALPAGSAQHLLDNYRVIRQSPRPGTQLRPGVFVRSGGSRGFRPTPITVWVSV